jgi:hypothetical protein
MAGDWIKMRVDLQDDPAVVALCDSLDLDEFAVIGRLHKLWAWADKHTTDGSTTGVTPKWLDRFVNAQGFFDALESVGWISFADGVLHFPSFEIHNGKSAKNRCDQAIRQRSSRTRHDSVTKNCDTVVTKPLPEERREEKSNSLSLASETKNDLATMPDDFHREDFKAIWNRWKAHRQQKQKPLASIEEQSQLYDLGRFGVDEAIEIVRYTLNRGALNLITNGDHKQKQTSTAKTFAKPQTKGQQLAAQLQSMKGGT